MEEKTQDYLSIVFDIKAPQNNRQSTINTIALLLRDIADMEDYKEWEDIDTVILNRKIDEIISELNNLKIIKLPE